MGGFLMMSPLDPTWDLDALYPDGSESMEVKETLSELGRDVKALNAELERGQVDDWSRLLTDLQSVEQRLSDVAAFIHCLTAQNVKDEKAKLLMGDVQQLGA